MFLYFLSLYCIITPYSIHCSLAYWTNTLFQLLIPTTIQKKEFLTTRRISLLNRTEAYIVLGIKNRCIKQNYILNLILKIIVSNILDTHKENKLKIKFKTDTQWRRS